jgi:PHS family inorganic phosphate transporter-like MFS transporter
MMAVTFGLLALIPNLEKLIYPFLIIYGFSHFFTEFGPNATTFVYPSEIFPVKVRTTGHGIAATMGKIGGFVGVLPSHFSCSGVAYPLRRVQPPLSASWV